MCSFHFWCLPSYAMHILCYEIKSSESPTKTFQVIEESIIGNFTRRLSIITGFCPNFWFTSTGKIKLYSMISLWPLKK